MTSNHVLLLVQSWDGIAPDTMMNTRIRNGIVRIRFVIVMFVTILVQDCPRYGVQATYVGYTDTGICVRYGFRDSWTIIVIRLHIKIFK